MTRRTRILLLIFAGILYCCSMACNASICIETPQIADLTEEVCDCYYNPTQGPIEFFDTPNEALPIARVKRTVQTILPTKVVKDRISSCGPRPKAVAQAYKQYVTSYLQYSNIISVSLPPEEIASFFIAFW